MMISCHNKTGTPLIVGPRVGEYCAVLDKPNSPVTPLYPQGAKVSSPTELARIADALQPGEWVWAGPVAPAGPVLIYVDLSRQRATVYRILVTQSSVGGRTGQHVTILDSVVPQV